MRILIRTADLHQRSSKYTISFQIRIYGNSDTETDTPTLLRGSDPSGNLMYMYISKVFKQTSAYVQRGIVSQIIRLVITSFSNTDVTVSPCKPCLGTFLFSFMDKL